MMNCPMHCNNDDDNNDSDSDNDSDDDNDDYILPKILLGKPVALLPNLFVPDNKLLSMNGKDADDGQDESDVAAEQHTRCVG